MMNESHVADRAALYALGALSESEVAAVQAHVRDCRDCERAVGDAERDVELIVAQQPQRSAPPALAMRIERTLSPARFAPRWPAAFVAMAAALLVGILPSAYFFARDRAMEAEMLAQRAAMARLVATPHRVTSFRASSGALAADVMYAPDGSWYVVLVKGISRSLGLAWMHDGQRTMLGEVAPHNGVAMLYLPQSHRMHRLALVQGDEIVAEAQLPFNP